MARSNYPSVVRLPDQPKPYPDILTFLTIRFPKIPIEVWRKRIRAGNVLDELNRPITLDFRYQAGAKLFYFREVEHEPEIPFRATIIFEDAQLLVACKPHFLPVTPGGRFVSECLLNRLKDATKNPDLTPLHRLDRDTAGLVMFSKRPEARAPYFGLFVSGEIHKRYEAACHVTEQPEQMRWDLNNKIVDAKPWFLSKIVTGKPNAHSKIELLKRKGDTGLFELEPVTGKKHQLRLHLNLLGFPIINDRFYPVLQPEAPDDFSKPLQLLAKHLEFVDPLTGEARAFTSNRQLSSIKD